MDHADQHLIDYVRECLTRGFTLQDIYDYLLERGYSVHEIDYAIEAAGFTVPLYHHDHLALKQEEELAYYERHPQQDETLQEDITYLQDSVKEAEEAIHKELPQPPLPTVKPIKPMVLPPPPLPKYKPLPQELPIPAAPRKEYRAPDKEFGLLLIQIVILLLILFVGLFLMYLNIRLTN